MPRSAVAPSLVVQLDKRSVQLDKRSVQLDDGIVQLDNLASRPASRPPPVRIRHGRCFGRAAMEPNAVTTGGARERIVATISPLADATEHDDVIAMLVEGSFDPAVREKNYLPACMDAARARAYCAEACGVVLYLDGRPVGVAVAKPDPDPGTGVEIPAGCPELDMWVLPRWRGQSMRWFPLIAAWMAQRFDELLGVTWADNHTAIALLRWSGWKWLGQSFWSCETCSGHCEVFLYDLRPHRAPTST